MLKHNKKRNVGLVTEFLSRHLAEKVIEKNNKGIQQAKGLWIKYLGEGSELGKEYALFNALYRTNVENKEVAVSLLEKVKHHCQSQDAKKLYKEKTDLIHEIKTNLDNKDFFNQSVPDYRICASIQILMNSWRENNHLQLAETTDLEDQILNHLIKENKFPPTDPSVLQMKDEDIDGLVVTLMNEKFNKKYDSILTETQRNIVNLYIFADDQETSHAKLVDTLKEVRLSTLSYIEYETTHSKDQRNVKKLKKIKSLLEGAYKNIDKLDDDLVTFYMTVSKLQEELNSETA